MFSDYSCSDLSRTITPVNIDKMSSISSKQLEPIQTMTTEFDNLECVIDEDLTSINEIKLHKSRNANIGMYMNTE